jgi:hypothetical protein
MFRKGEPVSGSPFCMGGRVRRCLEVRTGKKGYRRHNDAGSRKGIAVVAI